MTIVLHGVSWEAIILFFFASDAATEQNTLMSPFPELFSESFMGYPRFGRRNSHENIFILHCSNEKT